MDAIFEGVAPRCIHKSTSRLGLTRDLGTGRLDWRDPIFICDRRYRLKFVAFVPSIRAPACFSLAVSDDAYQGERLTANLDDLRELDSVLALANAVDAFGLYKSHFPVLC
jgi:hypothetical protein